MIRPAHALASLLILGLAACSCDTTSAGTCQGSIGGVDVSGPLDPASSYHNDWTTNQAIFDLSCGGGMLAVQAIRGSALDSSIQRTTPMTNDCAAQPDGGVADAGSASADGGSTLCVPNVTDDVVDVQAPADHPWLSGARLEAALRLLSFTQQAEGKLVLKFADGSEVTIDFTARHDDSLDIGQRPSSNSSGSHHHHHDWH